MAKAGAYRVSALVLAGLVFVADQAVKLAMVGPLALPLRGSIELLPIFRFVYVQNLGISMGVFTANSLGQRWALVAATAVIAVLVTVWLWRERRRMDALAMGAVLGGALGNIVDRARLGYVIDYANLHFGEWSPFLVFNVADAAITVGVLLLVLRALLTPGRSAQAEVR